MLLSSKVLSFISGFCIGVYIYYFLFVNTKTWQPKEVRTKFIRDLHKEKYENWLNRNTIHKPGKAYDRLGNRNSIQESKVLFDLVNVTCVIFVENPKNAYLIHNTWGRKCNSLYFYSKSRDNFIETHVIQYTTKWQYFCDSIRHLVKNSKNLQWILFTLDDVFVIPENLRYFLATKDHMNSYYYGHNVMFWQQTYNSDKTSFVLSKGAIDKLVNKFNSSSSCSNSGEYINDAAYTLGKHLSSLGIFAADSRDYLGRERFHIFTFEQLMSDDDSFVITKNSKTSVRPIKQGKECCSATSISFRSVQNDRVYFFAYLLYNMKLSKSVDKTTRKKAGTNDVEVWKDFVRKELGNVNLSSITNEKYYDLWRSKTWEPEEFNQKIREEILSKIHSII